jgi:hypothetical protein
VTPGWAYLFATLCGIVPVLTLGGLIPIMVACSCAGGCLTVARTHSIPLMLRLFVCLAITAVCWGVAVVLVYPALQKLARRF